MNAMSLIFRSLRQLFFPKCCVVCGGRLSADTDILCRKCAENLPRTRFHEKPYDNIMARMFWGRMPVERVAALFYYYPHSRTSRIVHDFKYYHRPDVAEHMGKMMAEEFMDSGFFDGIDVVVPLPLTPKRRRERGYNQSLHIAKGVADVTKMPIDDDVVERIRFDESQTKKNVWERVTNVENVFRLKNASRLVGKHVLLIDDITTTGATLASCGEEMAKAGDVRISVLTLGFAHTI